MTNSRDWFAARAIPRTEEGVILKLADLRQDKETNCGDVAIDVCLAYMGIQRKRNTRLSNDIQGLAPDTVAGILRAHGLLVSNAPVLTGVEGLKHLTRAGHPVLCPIADFGGHWVVCAGVERGLVHFHCPVAGPSVRRADKWLAAWTDTSAEPGHAFNRWGIACGK